MINLSLPFCTGLWDVAWARGRNQTVLYHRKDRRSQAEGCRGRSHWEARRAWMPITALVSELTLARVHLLSACPTGLHSVPSHFRFCGFGSSASRGLVPGDTCFLSAPHSDPAACPLLPSPPAILVEGHFHLFLQHRSTSLEPGSPCGFVSSHFGCCSWSRLKRSLVPDFLRVAFPPSSISLWAKLHLPLCPFAVTPWA